MSGSTLLYPIRAFSMLALPYEIRRQVEGYNGIYYVSNLGNVKSFGRKKKGRYLLKHICPRGYHYVGLYNGKGTTSCIVHGLVLGAFIGLRPQGNDINHINGMKLDNRLCNLEYCTRSDNVKHAYKHELIKKGIYSQARGVIQKDKLGNVVRPWDSISLAGLKLFICKGSICLCCKGKLKTAGGYRREYIK